MTRRLPINTRPVSLQPPIDSPRSLNQQPPRVGVLGAGIAGTQISLNLGNLGCHVFLVEKRPAILSGTSDVSPGRPSHGFHYIDLATGIACLKETMTMLEAFPNSTRGADKPPGHYLRHGMYSIMKQPHEIYSLLSKKSVSKEEFEREEERLKKIPTDEKLSSNDQIIQKNLKEAREFGAIFPFDQVLRTYEGLKEAYRAEVAKNPNRAFFGDPDHFYRQRSPSEFSDILNVEIVETVIETHEDLFNWPIIKGHLIAQITNHRKTITLKTNTIVEAIQYDPDSLGFIIKTNKESLRVDYVVNATWENIEKINRTLGFYPQPVTNRVKAIPRIKISEKMQERNSMFFFPGAHCMFSNMGDGQGKGTYAPVTNLESDGDEISPKMQRYLAGNATLKEKREIGEAILRGICKYLPGMKGSELIDVDFGVVKTNGTVDIHDPNSDFHKRNELGVSEQQIGLISAASMKLINFFSIGNLVPQLIQEQIYTNAKIKQIVAPLFRDPTSSEIYRTIIRNLQRYFLGNKGLKTQDGIFLENRRKKLPSEQKEEFVYLDEEYTLSLEEVSTQIKATMLHKKELIDAIINNVQAIGTPIKAPSELKNSHSPLLISLSTSSVPPFILSPDDEKNSPKAIEPSKFYSFIAQLFKGCCGHASVKTILLTLTLLTLGYALVKISPEYDNPVAFWGDSLSSLDSDINSSTHLTLLP